MRVVLAGINAKYIHSNLAIYDLKSYAEEHLKKSEFNQNIEIQIAEYTINQKREEILADLFQKKPDILGFSCYIWNISMVRAILEDIWKVLPRTRVWLGGPEVSYSGEDFLKIYPLLSGVLEGEGERSFVALLEAYAKGKEPKGRFEERCHVAMDEIPFVYQDMSLFEHRILYYESSRGCPFSCSYCMSSIDKHLRFRSLSLVFEEIQFFLDQKVKQVKFIDRTFNCQRERSREIWKYILEKDNQVTNFHFEIGADLLEEEDFQLISRMRPGLIQLEIGIQSTNEETLKEICRFAKFQKIQESVNRIRGFQNTHLHLDLIAGLPYEDFTSFAKSFNEVYGLKPSALQLGFLKVLRGTPIEKKKEEYELLYTKEPPYEVISTKWLSYEEILRLKRIEEMVEVYYNSNQFLLSLVVLEETCFPPFDLFQHLSDFYQEKGYFGQAHKREARYQHLLEFSRQFIHGEKEVLFQECLLCDYYGRENSKNRPRFFSIPALAKEDLKSFYKKEEKERNYLSLGYENWDSKQMERQTHLEWLPYQKKYVLFDYLHRSPLTGNGKRIEFSEA